MEPYKIIVDQINLLKTVATQFLTHVDKFSEKFKNSEKH